MALYEKWVHTDGTAVLYTDYIDIPYGNTVWVGDVTENKNDPDAGKKNPSEDIKEPENGEDPTLPEDPTDKNDQTNNSGDKLQMSKALIIGLAIGAAVIIVGALGFAIAFRLARKKMK